MTQIFDFYSRDYLKFYLLKETENGTAELSLALKPDDEEQDFRTFRMQERSVYRFYNFNVSEDAADNCVTFRPNAVGESVYFYLSAQVPVRVVIIRNGSSTIAHSLELPAGESELALLPQGCEKYELGVTAGEHTVPPEAQDRQRQTMPVPGEKTVTDMFEAGFEAYGQKEHPLPYTQQRHAELERETGQLMRGNEKLEEDIRELEQKQAELLHKNEELSQRKKSLLLHLDRLREEYEKDYAAFEKEAGELTATCRIDTQILSYYAGREVTPVQELIHQAEEAVRRLEEQIRRFVKAQEKKTAEIEKELK